jgi:hypothetical protein
MLRKPLIIYVILTLFCLFVFEQTYTRAEVISVKASKDYGNGWNSVQLQLESKMVSQVLHDYGMNSDEINSILQQLTNEDIHKLALDINQVVPAGDAVAVIIGILIIVILVIVILKLMNKEIIIR